jgi:O-antigen ligase
MQIFLSSLVSLPFRRYWLNFNYLYDRLLPGGLTIGIILLGITLAYTLVNFSAAFAILAVLAVPVGIILVTRPNLGLLVVVFAISFEEVINSGPGISALKLLSIIVFGGAVIHFLIFRGKEPLVKAPQNWLILLFVMAAILSSFVALDPSRTIDRTGRLIRVLILYLMVINLVRTKKDLRYLIWIFVISGFISALWGLLDPAQAGQRLYGTMGQPNAFAAAMVPRLPLIFSLMHVNRDPLKRFLLVIILGVVTYALILSGSRGGLISAVLALLLFVLTQKNKLFWFNLVGLITVIGLLAMPLEIKQRVGLVTAHDSDNLGNSTDRRETYQVYGWQLWQENPILGVGLDGFAEAYTRSPYRFLQKNETKRVAHNTYLEIAVGTGLIGFIPFVALLAWSFYKAWQYAGYTKFDPHTASISAGLFAGMGGYLLAMLFGSHQYDKILWLLIALVVVVEILINKAGRQRSTARYRQVALPQVLANGKGASV